MNPAADAAALLDDALRACRSLLVVTGAGISLASGIPTFRGTDRDAVWKRDVTQLGTRRFFREDPVGSWTWYLDRFGAVFDAKPNAAHEALVELETRLGARGAGFLLATQNVDGLHRAAGSKALVEVHGRADRVRCSRVGCSRGAPAGSMPRTAFDLTAFRARPSAETLPRCPTCGAFVRQHVLWFDETYGSHDDYAFDRVLGAAVRADVVLFVGTSFSVGATDAVRTTALGRGADVLSIDPGEAPPPEGVFGIRARAEELLPVVASRLVPGSVAS
jgi:NAD-dependent deacetylase